MFLQKQKCFLPNLETDTYHRSFTFSNVELIVTIDNDLWHYWNIITSET